MALMRCRTKALREQALRNYSENETMSSDGSSIGDRMKAYETPSTSRIAFKGQPLIARLDGKSFHTFTKGLKRPYDERLSSLMVDLTAQLVDRFGANIGYTQSDEITLAWYTTPDSAVDYPFNGRFQKLESVLAGYASAYFSAQLQTDRIPEKKGHVECFDCRAFVVPSLLEAYHSFLWRQQDATKNAISMAAQSMFPHKSLIGLNGKMMQEKMWVEKQVNFNDYPYFFKRGTFVRRSKYSRQLNEDELALIPSKYWPAGPVERSFIDRLDIWLSKQEAPVDVLFKGAPVIAPQWLELPPTGTGYGDPWGSFQRTGSIPIHMDDGSV